MQSLAVHGGWGEWCATRQPSAEANEGWWWCSVGGASCLVAVAAVAGGGERAGGATRQPSAEATVQVVVGEVETSCFCFGGGERLPQPSGFLQAPAAPRWYPRVS